MTDLSAAELSDLIASIYDRAIDSGGWSDTLSHMRRALGAENAALSLIDLRSEKFLLNFFDRIPDELLSRFDDWQREIIGLWGGPDALMSLPMNEPALLSQVNPASADGPNDYRDTFIAAGLGDAMSLGLARDELMIGSCVFGRARSAGRFTESDLALARLILPHAQRAMEFSRMFDLATLRANAFEAALDAAAVPTFLVSPALDLVHANAAGQAALERGDAVRVVGGRMTMSDGGHAGRLMRAMAETDIRPEADPRQLDIDLKAPNRMLRLLPLPPNTLRGTLAAPASAAIVLTPPPPRPLDEAEATDILMGRHGLTRMEAAVTVQIAKGDGRAAAAERLGIRENTVRTHLSSIFLKLGLNRQAQLVQFVARLSRHA